MKSSKSALQVTILSPFETFFDGSAKSVSALNKVGPFDILPGHINFMSLLLAGDVQVDTSAGPRKFKVERGIIKVQDDKVVVFANV